jgi:hypothetical protein
MVSFALSIGLKVIMYCCASAVRGPTVLKRGPTVPVVVPAGNDALSSRVPKVLLVPLHHKVTFRYWLNGSTQHPKVDTLLNVARLYGFKSMRTLCMMTPNQIAEAQRQKHRRVNRTTSRPGF